MEGKSYTSRVRDYTSRLLIVIKPKAIKAQLMNMHESRVRSSNFEDNDYEDHDDDARDAREVKQVTREEDEGYNTRDYSPFQIMLMMMRRENKYSQSDIKTTGICRGSRMSSESQTE